MAYEPKPKRNRWIGFLVAGGVITPQGVALLGVGLMFLFLMPPMFFFPFFLGGMLWALVIAGGVLTIVGLALLIHGYNMYQAEKAWDQRQGLAKQY